jgi:xanthine/uracil permease
VTGRNHGARGHTDGRGIDWPAIARLIEAPLFTLGLVALIGAIWLVMIAMGHRRYWALTLAGVIVMICVARGWLEVRRGPSWSRRRDAHDV